VIQGSKQLELYRGAIKLTNIRLLAFDADWDLAMLSAALPQGSDQAFVPIGTIPDKLSKRRGTAVGHPDCKLNFKVAVGFTRDSTIPSKQFFGPGGKEIFAADVNLIPIDATVNRGMSGGPVIVEGKVIGIISGTQAEQGRTFGWAIPASRALSLPRLANEQVDFCQLPPLRLLRAGQRPMLLKIGSTSERIVKLNYFKERTRVFGEDSKVRAAAIKETEATVRSAAEKLSDAASDADLKSATKTYIAAWTKVSEDAKSILAFHREVAGPLHDSCISEWKSLTEEQLMRSLVMPAKPMTEADEAQKEFKEQTVRVQSKANKVETALSAAVDDLEKVAAGGDRRLVVQHLKALGGQLASQNEGAMSRVATLRAAIQVFAEKQITLFEQVAKLKESKLVLEPAD
jgi:hypothetical protein